MSDHGHGHAPSPAPKASSNGGGGKGSDEMVTGGLAISFGVVGVFAGLLMSIVMRR